MLLYNGDIDLKFNPSAHRYTVGGAYIEGVTSILKSVISKEGLIPWSAGMASQSFVDALQPVLKGDTVLSADFIDNCAREAKRAYAVKRDYGADVGSIVHKAIENYVIDVMANGRGGDIKGLENPQASLAFVAFLEWDITNRPKYLFSEKVVYSRRFTYAGTVDVAFELNGKRYLGDWKTSDPRRLWSKTGYGGISYYPDHFLQTAAYDVAYEEEHHTTFDAYMVLYITKKGEIHTFENHQIAELKAGWIDAINLARLLKKLVKTA